MVSVSAGPAVTGLYPVVEVAGQPPTLLTDFVGAAAVTVLVDGQPVQLTGMGGLTANGMEFEQRDPPRSGPHRCADMDDHRGPRPDVLGRTAQSWAGLTSSASAHPHEPPEPGRYRPATDPGDPGFPPEPGLTMSVSAPVSLAHARSWGPGFDARCRAESLKASTAARSDVSPRSFVCSSVTACHGETGVAPITGAAVRA